VTGQQFLNGKENSEGNSPETALPWPEIFSNGLILGMCKEL